MTTIRTVAFDARYINDQYHGIGRHTYQLLDALARLDPHRQYIAYYNPGDRNTRFDMNVLTAHPNIALHPISLPLYLPIEQLIWPVLLAQAQADVFHSPYVVLPVLAHIPLIMTIHDLILERYPEYRPHSFLQKFYQPVLRLGVKRASAILTVSRSTSCDIQEYYGIHHSHIHVIGNAVDASFQRTCDVAHLSTVRKRYSLPERFILTIGAGRPHKNVRTLVEAFARLDASFAPSLVIGGEHDDRFPDEVGASIDAHGIAHRVIRAGKIREDDLPAVYSLADVFVFPSLVEGFGLPPLEAMACGTPILASTAPAVAEAVGDAALSFDALDVEMLAIHLRRVLSDTALQRSLRHAGLERVRAFTWERVAQKTLQAYEALESRTEKKHSRSLYCST